MTPLDEQGTHRRDAILSSFARKARRRLRRLASHFALLRWTR